MPKTEIPDEHLLHSAFHEAGHAVAALFLDCSLKRTYIYDKRKNYTGNTEFEVPRSVPPRFAMFKGCIAGMAGAEAALKHRPDLSARGIEDRTRLNKKLAKFDPDKREFLIEGGRQCARIILEVSWPFVEKVAEALVAQEPSGEGIRVLTGDEVRTLLGYQPLDNGTRLESHSR